MFAFYLWKFLSAKIINIDKIYFNFINYLFMIKTNTVKYPI